MCGGAAATVAGIMALLIWRFGKRPAWPVPAHPETYLAGSVLLVASQVISLVLLSAALPGDPVPWNSDALFNSIIVQTALSIYWGLLGFIGMLWGARSVRRSIWLTGAGFMTLVVLKLFAVDLGNTGTVERIISFIGIGALLLVVGYFAPAPPRASNE